MVLARYTSITLSLPLALLCGAQSITLVSPGNVPVPGIAFIVHRGPYVTPTAGGANQLFNFNALSGNAIDLYQWKDPASLPNAANFPGAQVALVNAGPDTLFFKTTSNGLERIGDTQTISALGSNYHFTTNFSNSILELKLPLTYGDPFWTDQFSGSFTVDGNTSNRNGAITGLADAWGRVVMPGGADTVAVLRVNTRMTESIPMTISGLAVAVQHTHNVVAYFPLWGKFPVFRSVNDTLASPFLTQNYAYTEWLDASAVGITEAGADPYQLRLAPNPASDRFNLGYVNLGTSTLSLRVMDLRGAVVLQKNLGNRGLSTEVINVAGWAPGIYQVVLADENGIRCAQRLAVVR